MLQAFKHFCEIISLIFAKESNRNFKINFVLLDKI
jgi:hypothetical protein